MPWCGCGMLWCRLVYGNVGCGVCGVIVVGVALWFPAAHNLVEPVAFVLCRVSPSSSRCVRSGGMVLGGVMFVAGLVTDTQFR